MPVPAAPKIYHIVHVDRLASIIAAGGLLCDAEVLRRGCAGSTIGMGRIKKRRLEELRLSCHPDLHVGDCVPFYFCPRSVMLFVIWKANSPELAYRGGQGPIVHLVADLQRSVIWAESQKLRWAFTDSNAGSYYFNDYDDLAQLSKIDWTAVAARDWKLCEEGKLAEFMLESNFAWPLVERIGVRTDATKQSVLRALATSTHRPAVDVLPAWYY